MYVVKLTNNEAQQIAEAMANASWEVLVAYDPIDDAFKVKIDGAIWSPPMGQGVK
jgi:hypothetical protein